MTSRLKFVEIAFKTDPRVIARAKEKFEVTVTEDESKLNEALQRLYDLAFQGHEPEHAWLEDASELADRIGRHWQFDPATRSLHTTPEQAQSTLRDHTKRREPEPAYKNMADLAGFTADGHPFGDLADLAPRPRPHRVHEGVLGIPETNLAAGTLYTIALSSDRPFRARRLVLDGALAGHLMVHAVQVGNCFQFGSSTPIPASVFKPDAFPLPIQFDTLQVGQMLKLTVENVSLMPLTVTGCFHGHMVES